MSALNLTKYEKEIIAKTPDGFARHQKALKEPAYVQMFDMVMGQFSAKMQEMESQVQMSYKQRVHAALLKELKIGGR